MDTKGRVQNWIAAIERKHAVGFVTNPFNVASIGEVALVSHMKGKKHTYLMGLKPKESLITFLAAPELPSEVEKSSSDLVSTLCACYYVDVIRFGNDSRYRMRANY